MSSGATFLAVVALAGVATSSAGAGEAEWPRAVAAVETAPGIRLAVALSPRLAFFGDTVTARVAVAVEESRIDPASLRIATSFEPWTPVGPPRRTLRREAGRTQLETVVRLRCLGPLCVARGQTWPREFDAAQVSYRRRSGERGTLAARWPVLVVNSRVVPDDFAREGELSSPWRADLVSLAAPSYRLPRDLLLALMLAGGATLGLAGGVLARRALPERARPAPLPEPSPEPPLPPLARALALLESGENGAVERRQALERVGQALEERHAALAGEARALAWAAADPAPEPARALALRVRSLLGAEERLEAIEEGDDAPAA